MHLLNIDIYRIYYCLLQQIINALFGSHGIHCISSFYNNSIDYEIFRDILKV